MTKTHYQCTNYQLYCQITTWECVLTHIHLFFIHFYQYNAKYITFLQTHKIGSTCISPYLHLMIILNVKQECIPVGCIPPTCCLILSPSMHYCQRVYMPGEGTCTGDTWPGGYLPKGVTADFFPGKFCPGSSSWNVL